MSFRSKLAATFAIGAALIILPKACTESILPEDTFNDNGDPPATEMVDTTTTGFTPRKTETSFVQRLGRNIARETVDLFEGLAEGTLEGVGEVIGDNGDVIEMFKDKAGNLYDGAGSLLEDYGIDSQGNILPMEDCIVNPDCQGNQGVDVILDGPGGKVIGTVDPDGPGL